MSVFSFKVLFIQIAPKADKLWSFVPVSSTAVKMTRYIFAQWQLRLAWKSSSLSKVKLKSVYKLHLRRHFLSLKAARHTAAQRSRAHPHHPGADLDDPPLMKEGVFSSSSAYPQLLFCFLQRYPNTINAYWVFVMRDNRIWNLEVKMTTHGISSSDGILALLVLNALFKKLNFVLKSFLV